MPTADSNVQGLVTIGYLQAADVGNPKRVTRAILRFQRHAARAYRMPQPDVAPNSFAGKPTGAMDALTIAEIAKWLDKKWVLPLNRLGTRSMSFGGKNPVTLRKDAADAWEQIVALADSKGATLRGDYGDSWRAVRPTSKVGASRYSFHYCARACDISQDWTLSATKRYFIEKLALVSHHQFWKIHCKTDKQDGGQGELIKKGTVMHYEFSEHKEHTIPEGYYLDLSALIESTGKFERIKAQAGWEKAYNKTEWWHFQYKLDKQATFLDEMELIGKSEQELRRCGWATDEMLDHAPG